MGWLAGWSKRIKITIDKDDITAALADFPVLLYLSTASGIGDVDVSAIFDEVGANSLKIAVTKADGTTECYVEVEKWDSGNEKAWLHVKIPAIAHDVDTDIYIYYDNTHADNTDKVGPPNSVPAENVWDANFYLVTHMQDDPDTSHIRDSTSNDLDGTKVAANKPTVTTDGIAADAQEWHATNDEVIDHGNMTGLDGVHAFTFEFFVKRAGVRVLTESFLGRGSNVQRVPWIYMNVAQQVRIHFETENGAGDGNCQTANLTYPGVYNHVAFAWDGSNVVAHLNGVAGLSDSTVGNTLAATDAPMKLGWTSGGWLKNSIFDELRISLNRRPIEWIHATYESGRDDLCTFGTEEIGLVDDSEDLACSFFVQLPSDSQDLAASFKTRRSASLELPSEFIVRRSTSVELPGEFIIRRSTFTTLPGKFVVRHAATTNLASNFTVRHRDTEDLAAKLVIRRSTFTTLPGKFDVGQDSQELLASFTVRHRDTEDLAAELTIRRDDSKNLLGEFSVRRSSTKSLACKIDIFHPGETIDLLGHFSVRRPGILLDITLEERDIAISLEERDVEITLQERDVEIALEERDITVTLQERGITISYRHEGQTMVNLGDTFQLKGECTNLDGAAEDPDSHSIKLYDVEDTLIDTDTNPTAGVPLGEFYANLEAKDTGETGAWTVLWEVTKGAEKRTVIFDVEVKSLLG